MCAYIRANTVWIQIFFLFLSLFFPFFCFFRSTSRSPHRILVSSRTKHDSRRSLWLDESNVGFIFKLTFRVKRFKILLLTLMVYAFEWEVFRKVFRPLRVLRTSRSRILSHSSLGGETSAWNDHRLNYNVRCIKLLPFVALSASRPSILLEHVHSFPHAKHLE